MAAADEEFREVQPAEDFKAEVVMEISNSDETADNESQNRSVEDVRSISDDQKLFLKVLENLKNAVNAQPDNKAIALPKKVSKETELVHTVPMSSIASSGSLADDSGILRPESHLRSDPEEPGTTTVTVSDKTKSLILQKLAVASEHDKTKLSNFNSFIISNAESSKNHDGMSNDHPESSIVYNQQSDSKMKVEIVKVTVMGLENVIEKVSEKDNVSTRNIDKENMDQHSDKKASTSSSPKVSRLIAPATPSVQLFTCNFCDYYSNNKSYLKQHMDLVHNSDRPFKCPYCDYAGKRSHALREHLIVHSNERPYQCKSCNATFRKKGHLTNHIKLHNSKRLVKCPLCKVLVYDTGENGLDVHLKNDHDTERLYGCDLCEYIAANEPGILKHLNEKHKSKISLHKCEKCPFHTANNLDFEGHVHAHNITEGKVQIGKGSPTKVIGVATIPAGSHNVGMPNSTIKMNTSQDTPRRQPAVIKPVWIKCSECGFTGQDSEIIRKHMMEHLKDQYGEDMATTELSQSPSPVKTISVPKQISAKPDPPLVTPKPTVQTPILVPVTKTLDMNTPVLVPVSDSAILKSLRGVPVPALQYSATSRSTPVPMLSEKLQAASKNVSYSNIVTLTASPSTDKQTVSKVGLQSPKLYPVGLIQNMSKNKQLATSESLEGKSVGTSAFPTSSTHMHSSMQNHIFTSSGLRIIPVKLNERNENRLSHGVATNVTSSIANAAQSIPFSETGHISNSGIISTATVCSPKVQTLPHLTLTEIPIPRPVNTHEIPKLPPEIFQLQSPVIAEEEVVEEVTSSEPQATEQQNIEEALRESIANVQKLIDQQEEIHRQTGTTPLVKLDAKGIPEKNSGQKVVYYMTPVGKHNTSKSKSDDGFTHDTNAGRFRCTLCGYTCEYQRTIKAHIWKHSGNKDIYYPMFQNGPLSIYEDGQLPKPGNEENVIEVHEETMNESAAHPVPGIRVLSEDMNRMSEGKMPSFIVYEQTKISNVAPALAHLIAARTMVGLKDSDNKDDASAPGESNKNEKHMIKVNDNVSVCVTAEQLKSIEEFEKKEKPVKKHQIELVKDKILRATPLNANVIVEAVHSVNHSGFTGLNSQQSSPRVTPGPKSPDSGVSEQTSTSKTMDEGSVSSGFISTLPNFDYIADDSKSSSSYGKDLGRTRSQTDKLYAVSKKDDEGAPPVKRAKVSNREDSAVTLLSLLKKGPNYNPACPPRFEQVQSTDRLSDISQVPSPGQEDSNSVGESDVNGAKRKAGISTSLLAVIEQLRERSKSEPDDEKSQTGQQLKKQSRRRSRKSSLEDNAPAAGIDNVEEFTSEGVVKFRCKLCHYANDSTVLLRQHMRLHKPKQEFECSLCEHIAESSEALQDHMIQHCKVRTYQCKLCNSAFNYKSQLRAHMRMHNDQDILLCDFCDFETRSVSALKAHTKSHLTKPPYKCELCKEEFITSFNLRIHKREGCYTSIDKVGNFKCDECDFTTMGRREMKNHQKAHMGRSTVQTQKRCPYCEHSALTIELIQQHIADIHGESKPLKCEMCGFVAVSIRSLKSHMKRHVNDQRFVAQPLEQYKCNLCGYVCHHLPSLKSHMWRHAADQHYSYEFTNDVINAAIDFDGQTDAVDTTLVHVETFKKFIYDKMKSKGLEHTRGTEEESALACCWVTFRCCQCGFETINKAELNMHMAAHSDVIKWTLDVPGDDQLKSKQVTQIMHG